jgi:hypothetical protein
MNKFLFINTGVLPKLEKPKPTKAPTSIESLNSTNLPCHKKALNIEYVIDLVFLCIVGVIGIGFIIFFIITFTGLK